VIRLKKGDVPRILVEHGDAWTQELLDALQRGETPSEALLGRYKHPEIKTAVVGETYGKCAYCESKIGHVYWGDIEHIRPKSLFPGERFAWPNLTLVCAVCNNHKSDYHSDSAPLVNPYADDPAEYLVPLGSMIMHKAGSRAGRVSVQLLKLNRVELLERRAERIQRLGPLLEQWALEQDPTWKQLLLCELCQEAKADHEFSAVVCGALSQLGVPLDGCTSCP
jgi:hypothetical protein